VIVNSNVAGAWIEATTDKLGDGGGFASFVRFYGVDSNVWLQAPAAHEGLDFIGWMYDGQFSADHRVLVEATGRHTVEAIYGDADGPGNGR
jgi:hypothetical protein